MYNIVEHSDNYSKKSGSLWQYYRDERAAVAENSESFKSKIRITGKTLASGNTKEMLK